MNFTVTVRLRNAWNFLWRDKQFDDIIELFDGFWSRVIGSGYVTFLILCCRSNVLPTEFPSITMGICIFGRYKPRFSFVGGGF
jgi:hypothetical protein